MFKKNKDMLKEIKEQMRGGKGNVEILHIYDQGEIKGKSRLIAQITVNPGSSIGFHIHENEEEIFYCLSGKGNFSDNGKDVILEKGDSMITYGGTGHSVECVGNEPLVMMAVILLY